MKLEVEVCMDVDVDSTSQLQNLMSLYKIERLIRIVRCR